MQLAFHFCKGKRLRTVCRRMFAYGMSRNSLTIFKFQLVKWAILLEHICFLYHFILIVSEKSFKIYSLFLVSFSSSSPLSSLVQSIILFCLFIFFYRCRSFLKKKNYKEAFSTRSNPI